MSEPTWDVRLWPDGWRYIVTEPDGLSTGWSVPYRHKKSAKHAALVEISRWRLARTFPSHTRLSADFPD